MLLYYQTLGSEMIHSIVTMGISSGASSQDFNPDSVYHLSDLGKLFNLSNALIF